MRPRPLLCLEDKLAAHDEHLRRLGRSDDRGRLLAFLVVALVVHLLFLVVPSPLAVVIWPPPPFSTRSELPAVVRWIPSPPPAPSAAPPPSAATAPVGPGPIGRRTLLIPSRPTAIAAGTDYYTGSEPVAEPPPRVAVSLPRDAETLIVSPSPPPPPEPSITRVGPPPTRPVLAPGGRVDPRFPPAARALRLNGSVFLEVEVNRDGTVGAVNVVRVSRRGVGFEAAAVAAVKRWRFVPGTHEGRPVVTTTSVEVNFK